jgi:hypothetical protein
LICINAVSPDPDAIVVGVDRGGNIMFHSRKLLGALLLTATVAALPRAAEAVPSFSEQTGQACTTCHVGAFGPQLTPFGRAFKIGGYTMTGGDSWASKIPLSAMVTTSFTNTRQDQPSAPHHYDTNNNPSLDQISVFLAGRLGDYSGGFVQLTYSGVSNSSHVDNADLRPFTTSVTLGTHEVRVGTTVNNNPTAQDPYNSTFAWGFPFIQSALAPTPAAQPMLVGAFNANTLGYTAYVWVDSALYLEAGAYTTPGGWALARVGNDLGGQGAIAGAAPYARVAYEYQWNNQAVHAGALYMRADVNPPTGVPFQSSGANGQDRYTDYAFDVGYQFLGDGTHIVSAQGIYVHEDQQRNASGGGSFALNQVRANVAYWYQNTYGATLGWQKSWGSLNQAYGTANGKPNSNAFIVEADWVPFGKASSFANPWVNLKLGVQYIAYTQFDGGYSNYDGAGRGAGANNTLLLFAWLAF